MCHKHKWQLCDSKVPKSQTACDMGTRVHVCSCLASAPGHSASHARCHCGQAAFHAATCGHVYGHRNSNPVVPGDSCTCAARCLARAAWQHHTASTMMARPTTPAMAPTISTILCTGSRSDSGASSSTKRTLVAAQVATEAPACRARPRLPRGATCGPKRSHDGTPLGVNPYSHSEHDSPACPRGHAQTRVAVLHCPKPAHCSPAVPTAVSAGAVGHSL